MADWRKALKMAGYRNEERLSAICGNHFSEILSSIGLHYLVAAHEMAASI